KKMENTWTRVDGKNSNIRANSPHLKFVPIHKESNSQKNMLKKHQKSLIFEGHRPKKSKPKVAVENKKHEYNSELTKFAGSERTPKNLTHRQKRHRNNNHEINQTKNTLAIHADKSEESKNFTITDFPKISNFCELEQFPELKNSVNIVQYHKKL